jgi:uncharacterized protein (DUF952 family)
VSLIYKILPGAEWDTAVAAGRFEGSGIDLKDGYIHFSSEDQWRETLRLHFAGRTGLVLVAVEAESLGEALKWEPSRAGQLFPHLYGALATAMAVSVTRLHDSPGARA